MKFIKLAIITVVIVLVNKNIERKIMGLQEDLTQVRNDLAEAASEIAEKIGDLEQQVQAGSVDPALLAEVKDRARALADIVPNAVDEPSEPEEPPVDEPVDEGDEEEPGEDFTE